MCVRVHHRSALSTSACDSAASASNCPTSSLRNSSRSAANRFAATLSDRSARSWWRWARRALATARDVRRPEPWSSPRADCLSGSAPAPLGRRRVRLQRRAQPPRSHRRVGAPPPTVWGRHDLPEAASGRSAGQSQARRSALRRGTSAGETPAPQEGAASRSQPLARPVAPNEVWSADFVFDRTAEGRVLKCLTIVDDSTTEAVAVVLARALGGLPVTRVLDTRHVQDGRQLFREVLDGPIRF